MRKRAAQATLALLAVLAVFGLWSIHITLENPWWPMHHHMRMLPFLAIAVAWVGSVIGAGALCFVVLRELIRAASEA